MRQKKYFSLFSFLLILNNGFGQTPSYSSAIRKMNTQECLNILETYQHYWSADSLSSNGFREVFAWEFIRRFDNLNDTNWEDVYRFLGNADRVIKNGELVNNISETDLNKGQVIYRYILSPNSKKGNNWQAPGVRLLHIYVVDGKIEKIGGQEMDG